jgi:hypothetical protein
MAITDSLISWWSLDETSGTRVDSHGSNDLTDYNTVLYQAGKQGNAADFELSNDEALYIEDNASLSFGDEDFTLACWVKMESSTVEMGIMTKWYHSTNKREYGLEFDQVADRFRFFISTNAVDAVFVDADNLGAPSDATWYYLVAWHDATANTINIQVNNGTVDSVAHTTGCNDNASQFLLGRFQGPGPLPFDGLIDEAAVWRRVLTADEKTALYNGGNGRAYGYWPSRARPIWFF